MFSSLANKRKIDEATSAKDVVAPVYILEELWQILQSSGPETSAGFVEYIHRRLSLKNPVIKQKALRLVKFVCAKGPSDFKRNIAKRAGTVRELQHYRGDPDPFKGDVPNQRVRETAKEALEAMFAPTEASSYSSSTSNAVTNRIQGFGSSNASDGITAPSSKNKPTSGMMGFGNPQYEPQSSSRGTGNSWPSRGGGTGYEAPGDSAGRSEGIGSVIQRVGSGALSPKAIMDSIAAKGNEFLQGKRGPGILNNDDQTGYSSDEADRGYEKPGSNGAGTGSFLGSLRTANGRNGGDRGNEASRLVDQICTPGGMRAQPTQEDLAIFVESAGSLDGGEVAACLADKMNGISWQASLRALCALEAVIQHGSTAACGEIAVRFQSEPASLETATQSPQASVRQRALRVLQLLGIGSSAAAPSTQPASDAPDLLGGLEDDPVQDSASQGTGAPATQQDLLGSLMEPAETEPPLSCGSTLLSGLALAEQPSAGPQSGLVDNLFQSSAPSVKPASADVDDLFGGLPTTGGNASRPLPSQASTDPFGSFTAPTAAQPSATPQAALDMDALLGASSSANSGTKTQSPDLAGMFSGLSTGPSSTQSPAQGQLNLQPPAAVRTNSADRTSDPLSSLGLPQSQQAPMGQGRSAQRGASPSFPAPLQGMPPQQPSFPGMPAGNLQAQQLTPQQAQYLHQVQYMRYMQMQAMQAQQVAGGFAPQMHPFQQLQQQQQQQPSGFLQQPAPRQPSPGVAGSAGGPISLDALTGGQPGPGSAMNSSSTIGISQQSDFDFVGDHVKTLRGGRK